MIYRFENKEQLFALTKNDVAIFPVKVLLSGGIKTEAKLWAEIPALVFPGDEEGLKRDLMSIKKLGINDVLCDNLGAIQIAKELGFDMHGGLFLNIMNEDAVLLYARLGLKSFVWSMEAPRAEIKRAAGRLAIPGALAVYGYMPLMKFRACPKKAANGDSCRGCSGISELSDRLKKRFPLICRDKKYSELLNCVPLYIADKNLPKDTDLLIYFTKESKTEAESVNNSVVYKKSYEFEKTGGIYGRELL